VGRAHGTCPSCSSRGALPLLLWLRLWLRWLLLLIDGDDASVGGRGFWKYLLHLLLSLTVASNLCAELTLLRTSLRWQVAQWSCWTGLMSSFSGVIVEAIPASQTKR